MNDTFDLFNSCGEFETLLMTDADVKFMRRFYTQPLSMHYMDMLLKETQWQQEKINVWGKQHWQPRLTAWYGDPGTDYAYSGIRLIPHAWTATLSQIKSDIEASSGCRFNSVLLNLYRDQHDGMGWHSDDEPELGPAPIIASLSLGATRRFRFKHKTRRDQKPISIDLTDGSLLIMAGATQRYWRHGIDKESRANGPRINLTFRSVLKIKNTRA